MLAKFILQQLYICRRKLTYGAYAQPVQSFGGVSAHIEQVLHLKGKDDVPIIFAGNNGGGVGFFIVTAQLCKNFVEADPHRNGEPRFVINPFPYHIRKGLAVGGKKVKAVCYIQPAFVNAERLHKVGVIVVDAVDDFAEIFVAFPLRRKNYKVGTEFFCRLYGLCGFYAVSFCRLVFGKNNAVAVFAASAHRDGFVPQFGIWQQRNGCVKTVAVAVENYAVFIKL